MNTKVKKELDNLQQKAEDFNDQVNTLSKRGEVPSEAPESEPPQLSQKDLAKSADIVLKPSRTISSPQSFNEKFRKKWEYMRQPVRFIAENKEITGEAIELWTRPFGGIPAEFWRVPVNKKVVGPRYLAEQIKKKFYNKLVMEQTTHSSDGMGQYYGSLVKSEVVHRLDAHPVTDNVSVFTGI